MHLSRHDEDARRARVEADAAQLPNALEAERTLWASLFLNSEPYPGLAERLAPEQFYDPRHQVLWRRAVDVYEQHQRLDPVTLLAALGPDLKYAGGMAYLNEISDGYPPTSMPDYYATLTEDTYRQRCVIFAAEHVREQALVSTSGDEALHHLTEASRQEEERSISDEPSTSRALKKAFAFMEACRMGTVDRITTGIPDLDEHIVFMPPDMWLLGGRSGMGKTTLALNIAEHNCTLGKGVGLFSLEMTEEQLMLRLLSQLASVSVKDMREGKIGQREGDLARLTHAAQQIASWPLYIDDTSRLTVQQLRHRAREWKRKHGIKLLMVDYFGKLTADGDFASKEQMLAYCCEELKALGKDLGICVMPLVQLNRDIERRKSGRNPSPWPTNADLRDTGQLEQEADIITFNYQEDPEDSERITLVNTKQRQGDTGNVPVWFERQFSRFRCLSERRRANHGY